MAAHAPQLGTLVYSAEDGRTVTFPGDVVTKISSKNIKTADGRGVKAVEHTLTVNGWIYSSDLSSPSGTCDNAFALMRRILSQSGGKLTIVGKGFGDYYINRDSSNGRDITFGPHPEVTTWEPFGNITCRFEWVVVFTLPWKDGAATKGGILDYTWETNYNYDSEGFCDRVITCEVEIAGTRYNPGISSVPLWSNIEQFLLDLVVCDCPAGMHREGHEIKINNAKTKATVTFTDKQDRGLTYPPGISRMDIVHEMSSQTSNMTLSNWTWAISITATPMAKFASSVGYEACLSAHQARFLYLIRNIVNSNGSIIPIPISFKIVERVQERTTSLTAVWMLMATGTKTNGSFTPVDILSRSGLWQPFPWQGDDYKQVADEPLGPNNIGGYTRLVADPSQNIIIDVSSIIPKIPDIGAVRGNIRNQKPPNKDTLILTPFGMYIEFKAWISCLVKGGVWVNYPLSPATAQAQDAGQNAGRWAQDIGSYNKYALEGYIIRVGIPPAGIPELNTIGGLKVEIPAGESKFVETKPVTNTMGLVMWRTDFRIPYVPLKKENSNPVKQTEKGNGGNQSGKQPGRTVLRLQNGELVEVPIDMDAN